MASATSAPTPTTSSTGWPSAGQRCGSGCRSTPIGPGDSPYQSLSAFAGSPLMVALEPLVERGWLSAADLAGRRLRRRARRLRRVVPWRMAQLRAGRGRLCGARQRRAIARPLPTGARREAGWLDDYALFMALADGPRRRPGGTGTAAAPARARGRCRGRALEHAGEIAFWRFVQWCFDRQCAALKAYANGKRRRDHRRPADLRRPPQRRRAGRARTCTCWTTTASRTVVAGVPPDDLGPEGQRWGNPLYRWDRMAAGRLRLVDGARAAHARAGRRGAHRPLPRLRRLLGDPGQSSPRRSRRSLASRAPGEALFDAIARRWARCRSSPRTWASSRPT